MAEKKRIDKEADMNGGKAAGANQKPVDDGPIPTVGPPGIAETLARLAWREPFDFLSGTGLGPIGFGPGSAQPLLLYPRTVISAPRLSPETIAGEQKLEDKIVDLRKENRELLRQLAETQRRSGAKIEELESIIGKLKSNNAKLNEEQRLQHLLFRVKESARDKLLESEEFRRLFEESRSCNAVVIAVDIRRSTELMLKAKEPEVYARFITKLCGDLIAIILNNYGFFDKFTGDGILAFFPDFYSGEHAPYWAMKAADECHKCFSSHYQANRNCFKSILLDVGLGIGIDYGEAYLVKMRDGLTVIGTPVVYACRMSGAKAGQTLLNQPAYEVMSRGFAEYVNFQESEIDMKHEGRTLAYIATLSKKPYEPKRSDWETTPTSPRS